MDFWTEGRVIKFVYRQRHHSQRASHCQVVNSFQAYLPLTIHGRKAGFLRIDCSQLLPSW